MFGLRKVYKLAGGRRWWQFWRPKQPQQQEKKQYVAVVDSWFGVPKGQLLCLLGPNGAGKTTSINCLIGERWGRGRGTLSWWHVLTGLPDWRGVIRETAIGDWNRVASRPGHRLM